MASTYQLSAFTIPLSEEQCAITTAAIKVIPELLGRMSKMPGISTDEIKAIAVDEMSACSNGLTESQLASAVSLCVDHVAAHPDTDEVDFYSFNSSQDDDGLLIHHDESIHVTAAANFTQSVMIAFGLSEPVVIEWANTCSSARSGDFGGGAVVVTQISTEMVSAWSWSEHRIAQLKGEKPSGLFIAQGRRFGADDDTCAVISADSADEAQTIFLMDNLGFSLSLIHI